MPNTNKKRPEPLFKHTNNKFTTLIKQYNFYILAQRYTFKTFAQTFLKKNTQNTYIFLF